MAYFIFNSEETMDQFTPFVLDNLKEALSRLVNRDNRLNLFEKQFWVIERTLKLDEKALEVSQTLVTNVP